MKTLLKTKKKTILEFNNPLKMRIPIAPPTRVHGRGKKEIKRVKVTVYNYDSI